MLQYSVSLSHCKLQQEYVLNPTTHATSSSSTSSPSTMYLCCSSCSRRCSSSLSRCSRASRRFSARMRLASSRSVVPPEGLGAVGLLTTVSASTTNQRPIRTDTHMNRHTPCRSEEVWGNAADQERSSTFSSSFLTLGCHYLNHQRFRLLIFIAVFDMLYFVILLVKRAFLFSNLSHYINETKNLITDNYEPINVLMVFKYLH